MGNHGNKEASWHYTSGIFHSEMETGCKQEKEKEEEDRRQKRREYKIRWEDKNIKEKVMKVRRMNLEEEKGITLRTLFWWREGKQVKRKEKDKATRIEKENIK